MKSFNQIYREKVDGNILSVLKMADRQYHPQDPDLGRSGNYLADFLAKYGDQTASPIRFESGTPEVAGNGIVFEGKEIFEAGVIALLQQAAMYARFPSPERRALHLNYELEVDSALPAWNGRVYEFRVVSKGIQYTFPYESMKKRVRQYVDALHKISAKHPHGEGFSGAVKSAL